MKIDIHTHTKKCKSGDAPTREIQPSEFCEIISSTAVGIVAITNHNFFDYDQFREILKLLNTDIQVWPGIELDVIDGGNRGHLLVIVSPLKAKELSDITLKITKGHTPDSFTISIEDVLSQLDDLQPLYVAHYKQKKPDISDETIQKLTKGTKNPRRILKEVTNSISAGIYISHGHPSIYGSDVHNWATYKEESHQLPDLRLPVESFEHFCLLLEKDPTTINTALDRKIAENFLLTPFSDGTLLKFKAYNDINVIFGSKGTGKSCILEAIAEHYRNGGKDANVYVSASDRLDEILDLKGRNLTINLKDHQIKNCEEEIKQLKASAEIGVTSLSKYVSYFRDTTTNKNAKKIKLKDIEPEKEGDIKREFAESNDAAAKMADFLAFIKSHPAIDKELSIDEKESITKTISNLKDRLNTRQWGKFTEWKVVQLLNSAIQKFRTEIEKKTGKAAKPTSTGFREYAINRFKIEHHALTISANLDKKIPTRTENIGQLGTTKGKLELVTEFTFQNGSVTDSEMNKYKASKKNILKLFSKNIRTIITHAYEPDLFSHISELNKIEDIENITSLEALLLFKRFFALEGKPYVPSSGEASMVMLQRELDTDKEIYILDEPERSLGNEYISEVIVNLIKERARAGKKIFISTHDANIAVRTLPYSSIYRTHGPDGYSTYVGNPFSNNLINPENEDDRKDWKRISMKTLEGGVEAFGERGKIYGNL